MSSIKHKLEMEAEIFGFNTDGAVISIVSDSTETLSLSSEIPDTLTTIYAVNNGKSLTLTYLDGVVIDARMS